MLLRSFVQPRGSSVLSQRELSTLPANRCPNLRKEREAQVVKGRSTDCLSEKIPASLMTAEWVRRVTSRDRVASMTGFSIGDRLTSFSSSINEHRIAEERPRTACTLGAQRFQFAWLIRRCGHASRLTSDIRGHLLWDRIKTIHIKV